MTNTLSLETKRNIIDENLREVFKNHLCGNYIDLTDVDMRFGIVEWTIYDYNNGNFRMVAYTEVGEYSLQYDFDFTFDENLQDFYEGLVEYCLSMDSVGV